MEVIKVLIQGGVIAVIVGFIQFLITRKDTKNDRIKALEEKFDTRMDAFEEKVEKGLKDREDKGFERFTHHEQKYNELKSYMVQHARSDEEREKYMKCVGRGVMMLIHKDIMEYGNKYSERNAITIKEKAELKGIYMPYKGLGGNGDGEEIYNFCMNLRVVSEEEALKMDEAIGKNKKRRADDK